MTLPLAVIIHIITVFATFYGVDPALAVEICFLESSFNPAAVGDEGKSVGAWQFKKHTWNRVRTAMGLDTTDYRDNFVVSTYTAMYAMGVLDMYSHWSAYPIALKNIRENKYDFLQGGT